MNPAPLISVVIPAYNRQHTIGCCIDSVLEQSYPNFEILVVDDCSADSTCDVVKSIKDERIRLIALEKNSGAQAARNHGIKNAKGDWIAFLDSDDYWKQDKLLKQVELLKQNSFDYKTLIHSNCECSEDGHIVGVWELPKMEGNVYRQLLRSPGPMFQGMLVSKKALEEIGYLDESVVSYQEWDTSIRLARVCNFIHISEPTFVYCCHQGERISNNKKLDIEGYFSIIKKYKQEMDECLWNQHLYNLFVKTLDFGIGEKTPEILQEFSCTCPKQILQWTWKIGACNKTFRYCYKRLIHPAYKVLCMKSLK